MNFSEMTFEDQVHVLQNMSAADVLNNSITVLTFQEALLNHHLPLSVSIDTSTVPKLTITHVTSTLVWIFAEQEDMNIRSPTIPIVLTQWTTGTSDQWTTRINNSFSVMRTAVEFLRQTFRITIAQFNISLGNRWYGYAVNTLPTYFPRKVNIADEPFADVLTPNRLRSVLRLCRNAEILSIGTLLLPDTFTFRQVLSARHLILADNPTWFELSMFQEIRSNCVYLTTTSITSRDLIGFINQWCCGAFDNLNVFQISHDNKISYEEVIRHLLLVPRHQIRDINMIRQVLTDVGLPLPRRADFRSYDGQKYASLLSDGNRLVFVVWRGIGNAFNVSHL